VKHSSSKKHTIARVLMFVLALCLVLAVAPQFTDGTLPVASAAEYAMTSGSLSEINTALANYASSDRGCTVNVTLSSDVDFSDKSLDEYTYNLVGLTVPAGITVNLYMNTHTIGFTREGLKDSSQGMTVHIPGLYGIENNGTLNVYAGSKSNPNPNSGTASIALKVSVTGMDTPETWHNYAFCDAVAIRNAGTLTVGKNVVLDVNNVLTFDDGGDSAHRSLVNVGAAGVYNTSSSAKATLNTVTINCYGYAFCANANYALFTTCRKGAARALVYGVYGGDVTINGDSNISTTSDIGVTDDGDGMHDYGRGRCEAVTYGVCSSGKITINGGEFSYGSRVLQAHDGMCEGWTASMMGAVLYKTGSTPTITDGTVKVAQSKVDNVEESKHTYTIFESPVGRVNTLPLSGTELIAIAEGTGVNQEKKVEDNDFGFDKILVNWGIVTGVQYNAWEGEYFDEAGNKYTAEISYTDNVHPKAIVRGAPEGTYRVHIIYRYWQEANKTNLDKTVVGSTGLAGYSFLPVNDGTDIVKTKAAFSGLTASDKYLKTADSGISYTSGGQVYNSYYWNQYNVAWATPTGAFSDVNFATNKGIVFHTIAGTNASGVVATGVSSPVYIFVDYYRIQPTTIIASAGTADVVTTTYTGSEILASDLGLKITNSTKNKDFTADYNIDLNDSSKIDVDFSYTGTNAAGVPEHSDSGLPTNAGTYHVTMHIDDQTAYNKDSNYYKNRKGLDYTFTLTVNPAKATRGNLPTSVSLTYGTKLASVLQFTNYNATGIGPDGVQTGEWSFTNVSDGTGYKNVGTDTVSVTWTPVYASDAITKNYDTTTFTVDYSVAKAALTIAPNAAVVTYGETTFATPFSVNIEGLAGNDNTAAVKSAISNSLSYMINKGGSWVAYTPDQIGAGTYSIRATFEGQLPDVMSNYTYSYVYGTDNNPFGNLTVNQRSLTVTATAVSREYIYDNRAVNVTFVVTDGIYGIDDVNVATTTGAISNYNVGTRTVTGIDKAKVQANLTGGAAANYVVGEVIYATGDTLTVQITKATPVVGTPTTDERYYQMGAKLADVTINSSSSSVNGSWQWVDANINPTVAVKVYQAKFVPNDSANYNEKIVDVTVNVKPTPVVISYTKTVSYGDKKPNITDFTYTAAQDPTFSFDKLDCEGNISVSTTYEQGSPVNAAGYPVTISAANYTDKGGNYTFTIKNGTIYVTKKLVTFTVKDVEITYGSNFVLNNSTVTVECDESDLYGTDTVNSVTANGEAPTFTFTSDYSAQTNYGAGTYTIAAHNNFTTSANYDVEFVDGTLTVLKADLTISAKPMTVEYNTEISDATLASAYTVSGAKKNETLAQMMTAGTIGVDTTYYKGAVVNADGYPITIDVSECRFPNYNVVVNNSVITVVKATPVISTLPTASLVHNQTLSQAVFTGAVIEGGITGTFAYNSDIAVVYSSVPYNYPATFIPDDTANYNTVAIPALSLYVSKLPVSGELAIAGIPMKGETLTADVTGLNPDEIGVYTFSWSVGGTVVATGTTYTLGDADVNKVVVVTATANGYYEGTKTANTSKITPRLTSIETILDEAVYSDYFTITGLDGYKSTTTITYDGASHIAAFALSDSALSSAAIGDITVKYNGSTAAPKAAGYYTVTIDVGTPSYTTISDRDGKTYDQVAGKFVYSSISGYQIGTLYIAPKDYTVTLSFNDKVYDGTRVATATYTETGACTVAGGVKDDVAYDASAASYAFSDVNVGTGKSVSVSGAALKGSSAANYNLIVEKADTAAITPATLRVTVEPVSRKYEKDNYTVYLGFTVDTSSLAATDSTAQVYVDDTNAYGTIDNYGAGTRFVTVHDAAIAGSKSANYVLELTNASGLTVEITKATPSYPIPSAGVVYYNSARALSEISLGYDNWQWDESVRNTVPTAGTHTYKAVFTPNDTENEATVEYNVKLTVNKAPVTIKIASFNNVVYGDNVPTYYYTATGLTGTDTIKKSVDGYILLDSNYSAGSPVGTYSIVRTGEFESDNYSFTYVSGSITVNPRTVYTTAEAVSRVYEAGNRSATVSFSELSNVFSGDASSVYLSANTAAGTVESDTAGTKKVTYTAPTLAGDKAANYTLHIYNANVTVEIEKATIDGIVFPALGVITYGQRLSNTVFAEPYNTKGLGTFSMENPTTTPTAVGTFTTGYNCVFTPKDTVNYATVVKTITLEVATANLAGVVVQVSGTTQVGKTLYATASNIPAGAAQYITYQWYRVDSPDASYQEGYMFASGTDSVTLTESEQGKYIIAVAVAKDGSPYAVNSEARTDEAIQAETLSFWQRLIKWLYKIMSGLTQLFGHIGGK